MTPARARRWLAAVVCASALIGGWQIGWGLPSDYGWAPDELVPSAVLRYFPVGMGASLRTKPA